MTEITQKRNVDGPHSPLAWLVHSWTGPAVLTASAVAMLVWTWGRYCHPFIDFGRELYVAWRLSAGEVLYRDIDYFNGPLSPYLNGLIFRMFGTSLLTLEIANLAWWTALAVLAYRFYLVISDRLCAFVVMLLFITLFSFLQLNDAGNDNFVTPYSHEITHSLVCAYAMLTLLWSYLRGPSLSPKPLLGCGVLLGMMFLMKVEVTVSAGAALAVGVALRLISDRATVARWGATVLTILIAALIPSIIAFLLLRLAMPAHQALAGLLGSWKYLRDPRITDNRYYRRVMGTDLLGHNIVSMMRVAGCELLALLPPAIGAMLIRHRSTNETKWFASCGSAAYVIGLVWIFWDQADWHGAMKPLNLVAVGSVLTFFIAAIRQRAALPPRLILQLAFSVFAALMVSKTFFNLAIFHYGFALSGPVFALLVMGLVRWFPRLIHQAGGTGWVFRAAALAALGCFCAKYLDSYQNYYRSRPAPVVGTGADQFGVYQNAEQINATLAFLNRLPAGDTVATIPQGAMMNYLSRRINPTGELLLLPGEVAMFGAQRILDRFVQHAPDWIVDIQTNVAPYGSAGFGVDYAQPLVRYIRENYDAVSLGLPPDLQSPIRMLKRDPGHRLLERAETIPPSPAMSLPPVR